MSNTTNQSLSITTEQKERLRQIALDNGLTIGRGSEKDWGSINKLAEAIADGRLVVVPASAADWLDASNNLLIHLQERA